MLLDIKANKQDKNIITNFLNLEDCKYLINYFETNKHKTWNNRKEFSHRTLHFKNVDNIAKQLLSYYQTKLKFFIEHFYNCYLNNWNEPEICRWLTGESMSLHGDNANGVDNMNFSSIMYLNDDYTGGEIQFSDKNKYRLSAGSVIFFDSDKHNFHEVLEIKAGKRYTIPLWFKKI
jgi:predicted 2-oxoglutarate/Fe(II)-dependent dioxygenase YbiX